MTINYTNLLGLAKPVTGTETGQWGDVVNDQITELIEDAVANASSISVTSGDVTLTTTTGSSNQARMAVLLITGSPGVSRNIIAPSQSKWYIVKNSSNASIVVKGSATTGVTILADTEALVFWNGSDFEVAGLVGPSSSTDNAVARFDSTTGKVIQNSGVTIDDSNNVSGVAQLNATTADLTNLEVTNIKAKDGTAAASIADSTGVISITSNPILSGGTANGVLYLNGSKVATSGSALTFDGTNFATTGTASATKLIPTGGAITGNGMYLPAANSVSITTNGANAIYIDANQNVGFGTTLAAWGSGAGMKAIQMGGTSFSFLAGSVAQYIYGNAYYDGTNNRYINNGTACSYGVNASGQFQWFQAPSGTAGNAITFTQAMTLDASGRLLLGTTTTTNNIRLDEKFAIVGVNVAYNGMALTGYTGTGNAAYRPVIDFNRSRGTTDGSMTVLANNDYLGSIIFRGSDGTSFQDSAMISAEVDGTPGAGDMPGRLTFWTSPDGSTTVAERMRLDSSGNLGLGVTPSAWGGSYKAIEFPGISVANLNGGTNQQAQYLLNAYDSGAGAWKYKITGVSAAMYRQSADGAHEWHRAPSGTAGNTISFTQAMTLDASGKLMVGTTSPGAYLHVVSASASGITPLKSDNPGNTQYGVVFQGRTIAGTDDPVISLENYNGGSPVRFGISVTDSGALAFLSGAYESAAGTERARITSGGNLLVGTTTDLSSSYAYQVGSARSGGFYSEAAGAGDAGFASVSNAILYHFYCASTTQSKFYVENDGDAFNRNGTYGTISDIKHKQDVIDAPSQWDDLKAIRFRKYRMKSDVQTNPDAPYLLGVVAQELEQVSPGLVSEDPDFETKEVTDEDGNVTTEKVQVGITKTVKSSILLMKAAVALQEAMTRIEQLEAKVAALESKGA